MAQNWANVKVALNAASQAAEGRAANSNRDVQTTDHQMAMSTASQSAASAWYATKYVPKALLPERVFFFFFWYAARHRNFRTDRKVWSVDGSKSNTQGSEVWVLPKLHSTFV